MRKILSALLALGALTLGSCYEDKGNYSYNFDGVNSVDTSSFTPEAYSNFSGWGIDFVKTGEADTTTERVTANPIFSSPELAEEMEYYWYRTYTWNGQNVQDTLRTPGYMEVLIPNNGDVVYNVILEIRDSKTDISYFTSLRVRTRDWYTNSLFVLHGNAADNMRLGNQVRVGRNCILTAGNGKLELADHVSLSPGVHLCADGGSIFIGVKTAIGPGTVIRSANHCFTRQDVPIMEQGHEPGVVVIEDDVWIAANCTVTPNVRIGRGAVVTRDVQPYDIVAGVPARPIGKRGKDDCLNQVGEMDDDMY